MKYLYRFDRGVGWEYLEFSAAMLPLEQVIAEYKQRINWQPLWGEVQKAEYFAAVLLEPQ